MYRFLIKTISMFVFPRTRRRIFRDSRLKPNPYLLDVRKFHALGGHLAEVRTLVLGSSHAYYGYVAGEGEFNLAMPSCDLRYAKELYAWCCSRGCPKLKNVVLFYDVFSPGFRLEMTGEAFRCVAYEALYGIPTPSPNRLSDFDGAMGRARMRRLAGFPGCDEAYRGNSDFKLDLSYTIEERVAKHLKHNRRSGMQRWLDELRAAALGNGHRLFVVIPPLRQDYRRMLPPEDDLFADLRRMKSGHPEVEILDLQASAEFGFGDFLDFDHLGLEGAEKLTKIIRAAAT